MPARDIQRSLEQSMSPQGDVLRFDAGNGDEFYVEAMVSALLSAFGPVTADVEAVQALLLRMGFVAGPVDRCAPAVASRLADLREAA